MSDRYVLSTRIARGGMAEIFLGKAVSAEGFESIVAIKRILPHLASDREFVEMFRDEAQICRRLHHENIVQVMGFGEVEGSYAIIMEFVDGTDLRSLLSATERAGGRMPVPTAIDLTRRAALGLHYAHTKVDEITNQPLEIVHRDVSPQNILVGFDGTVKITDFGIADADNKMTETKPGVVKGKYAYMSPEQISAKTLDARSDVFSLAVVLWEMLAMRRLFQGDSEVETIKLVQAAKIPFRLSDLNPECDATLQQIVHRGLAKDPDQRFASAAQFAAALAAYQEASGRSCSLNDLGGFVREVLTERRRHHDEAIRDLLSQPAPTATSPTTVHAQSPADLPDLAGSQAPIAEPAPPSGGHLRSHLQPPSRSAAQVISPRAPGRPSRRRTAGPQPAWVTLAFAAALVLLSIALYWRTHAFRASQAVAQLHLDTVPRRVRLFVDGRPQFGGRYIDTPRRIRLPAGRVKVAVARQGYQPIRRELTLEPGETVWQERRIFLEPARPLTAVRFLAQPGTPTMRFSLNDGFHIGRPGETVPDLVRGMTHAVKFLPDYPLQTGAITCRFRARETSPGPMTIVFVHASRKPRCRLQQAR